ncbi:ABC transporter permease [Saccharopolyspora sp. K220]|uniref:ABC transporter permease n=1 Tax=Saccharopolyspora soli TaxID=2926618 RepID=UPI001F57DC17|nr:ABC transporter permease [Saccharopolyspora soli]MCI2419611.1 ABC transporter permease [Saccharopolyspora soli]
MTWLTWRQHRLGLAGFAAVFLGLVVLYAFAESLDADAWSVYTAAYGFSRLVKFGEDLGNVLLLLPLLVGMFAGAPLVSRELEHNTFRYAWTQGVSTSHWLCTKVFLVGSAVLVLSTVYAGAHMMWFEPMAAEVGWFRFFNQAVPVFPASCLFAFALGVLAGALLKRTVPAMAVTLVGGAAVFLAVALLLRPNYLAPMTLNRPVGAPGESADPLDGAYHLGSVYRDVMGNISGSMAWHHGDPPPVQIVTYHPADRFWPFQFIEAGIYLALTTAFLALAVVWLRRKLS